MMANILCMVIIKTLYDGIFEWKFEKREMKIQGKEYPTGRSYKHEGRGRMTLVFGEGGMEI